MRKVLDTLYTVSAWAGAACVLAICSLMIVQAVLRLNGAMVRGADDITAWLCASAAFLPLAATFRRGELVRMGILIDRLGERAARWFELVALGLCASFALYLTFWLANLAYESWLYNDRGQGLLALPLWIPQAPVAVGAGVLALALADEWLRVAAGLAPTYVEQLRERHAAGDYSGEV
jgi:TRAP-type C4-dicarboxylate transport system permease small subunit